MIKIDSKYDVVLTFSRVTEITGHIFECFDYYLVLRSKYKTAMLFLASIPPEQLKIAFESKYNVPFDEIKDDLIYIDYPTFKKEKIYYFDSKTVVIITDGDILALERYDIFFRTKYLMAFNCANHEFQKCKFYKNIIYLQDYRLYGKNKYFKSYDYVKKLPFKYYKRSTKPFENIGLIYMTFNCRKLTPYAVKHYHEMSNCDKTLLVVPEILEEFNNIDGVEQVLAPLEDFINKFDIYIYTPYIIRKHEHFDCSPRLITECFLNKKKIFLAINYIDKALETRYNDSQNNLESLNLKLTDDIFSIIEDVRNNSREQ